MAELGALVEQVRATGLAAEVAVEGPSFPLGAAAELTVYRIVQEALTNALRHAEARRALVTITYHNPEVRVRVADDGPAPGQPPGSGQLRAPGHGLDGMRERVALHDGTLFAGPAPGGGGGWLVEAILRTATPRPGRVPA